MWTTQITHSQLEQRFDVEYYDPKYFEMMKKLEKLKELTTLNDIARVFDGPFGSELHCADYVSEGIPFLRVQNVKENRIDLDSVVFISKEDHERLRRSALACGDIVMTKTGWLGIAAVIPENVEECNIRADLAGIVLKPEFKTRINPYYVAAYLNSKFGRFQSERYNTGSTRPRILVDYIKKIKFPLISRESQDEIADIVQKARTEIMSRIQRTEELDSSVSEIVLKELGIRFIEIENRRIFSISHSELGRRLDVLYYHPKYSKIPEELEMSPYEIKELDNVSRSILSGSYVSKYVEKGTLYLRVKNIKESGLDLGDVKFVDIQDSDIPDKIIVKPEDILLTRTGTIGLSLVAPEEIVGSVISQHLTRIAVKKDMNPFFVVAFLNTKLARLQMERGCTGSMQKELVHKTLKSLKMPKPPREVQDEIVDKIRTIRNEANQLRFEAEEVARKTKKRVEQLIEQS